MGIYGRFGGLGATPPISKWDYLSEHVDEAILA